MYNVDLFNTLRPARILCNGSVVCCCCCCIKHLTNRIIEQSASHNVPLSNQYNNILECRELAALLDLTNSLHPTADFRLCSAADFFLYLATEFRLHHAADFRLRPAAEFRLGKYSKNGLTLFNINSIRTDS